MMEKLQPLIDALREELQHYGEMLARLDHHQELVMRRESADLLRSVAELEEQSAVIQQARRQRGQCLSELGAHLGLGDSATFAEVSPLLPDDYRPLVNALVQENNELLVRIQQRSRQNHLLLARMVEMTQRVMSMIFPGGASPVYDHAGMVLGPGAQARSLYEAVG